MLLDESGCIYRRMYANKKPHTHRWKNVPFPTIKLKGIRKVIKHFTVCDKTCYKMTEWVHKIE